jgi:NAD-dependent deacetylase
MATRITVISGAGISAESGLPTYRGPAGLWRGKSFESLASPHAWRTDPATVLAFYDERRAAVLKAAPNAAHLALAQLERAFDVCIVTQNIDDLHERAGSSRVIHIHGEILKARSTVPPEAIYPWRGDIALGDRCERGGQLRPHVVWFNELVLDFDQAMRAAESADKVLVVGTSLSVFPAARLLEAAQAQAEKVVVAKDPMPVPPGFTFMEASATQAIPQLAARWLSELQRRDGGGR